MAIPLSKNSARKGNREPARFRLAYCNGRTIWIPDAHRDDGKRFVVHADEKLTAFLELESAIRACGVLISDDGEDVCSGTRQHPVHRLEQVRGAEHSDQFSFARPDQVKPFARPVPLNSGVAWRYVI